MDKETATSAGIKLEIPPELQNEIDEIALKRPRKAVISSDLDDDQKRWLVVGICLHSVLSPALRKYVDSILLVFHNDLILYHKIDMQIYPAHLKRDPHTGVVLNYDIVNNNKANYGRNRAKYDYTIKNAVDLSKLFLQSHIALYTGFDETCDSSALLGLILNIAKFDPVIKADADNVRKYIRNPWAHCDFTEWEAVKFSNSFQLMKKLVKDLKLSTNEEGLIIDEMEKWELNGQRFLSGTTHGLELVNELRQQTHVLTVYAALVATETDDNFMRIKNELKKFEIIFDRITQLIKNMKQELLEIDKRMLAENESQKKHTTQIGELEENVLKCACHDSHNVDIEHWKDLELMFVETPVVKVISQILESKQNVLIVGEPGIGKRMLLHHIALQLHNTHDYSIVPCSGIPDIRYHFKRDIRQIFVLDDICGRLTVSLRDIDYLLKHEYFLKLILQNGKSKIAATCRLDIYNDERFHASCSLFTFKIFNLSAEYSKEDKLTICTKYLSETNMQVLKDQNEPFTPLMCYLYSKNDNFNLTDFFHCSYEVYRKEWDKLQSIDPHKYCALFLCVIYNGSIKESLFDIHNVHYNKNQEVLINIFDICGINQGTSLSKMKKVLDQIVGTYLRKTKTKYRVIHDRMFDFMCCYFGNTDILIRSILRYACIEVVSARTQLESINEQSGKYTIMISTKYEQTYFERIKNDLQRGNLHQWFNNEQMKFVKYRASFIKALKSIDHDYLTNHHCVHDYIIESCYQGHDDMVKYFVSQHLDLDKGYHNNTPLTVACLTQNSKMVKLLIDKGCDVNQVDGQGETPLTIACHSGNVKIVQLLIYKGVVVNQVNSRRYLEYNGWSIISDPFSSTPLFAACKIGNEKIVQLLIDTGWDVNQDDGWSEPPLIAACKSGNEKIVQLLIDRGCDVNRVTNRSDTYLVAACHGGNEKIVQLLIDKGCDVNQVTGWNETPLTIACMNGYEKIVKLLVDKGVNVNELIGMRKTALIAACKSGNEKVVQLLIDKGVVVNQVSGNQETPLIVACESRNEKIVKLLIDSGCDVNQDDRWSHTPLIAACKSGNEKIVRLLVEKGCDVNQEGIKSERLMMAACESGDEKIVQLLVDKGAAINQVTSTRHTLVSVACEIGNEKIVRLLVEKGVDVNQLNGMGDTPLTVACKSGNEKIVQLLIDRGGDVNQVNGNQGTPLIAACNSRNEKIVKLLIDSGSDVNKSPGVTETPLIAACNSTNEKIVQLLVDKGCDVFQMDSERRTPLIAACKSGNEQIVQLLVDKGSDVNQVDDKGRTPLTVACNNSHEKIVQLLIEKGGDVNQSKGMTQTPLTAACNWSNENIVELLLDAGSDVNKVDGKGNTPLTAVYTLRSKKILQLLIDNGGDVNQINDNGKTPLVFVCKWGNEKTVQLLISNGCDINQVNGTKETPLTAACFNGNESIVQLLMDKGCDVNEVDGKGQTPLTAACEWENEKIVQLLIDKGGDVNQVDGNGDTPLTAAKRKNNSNITKLLEKKESDVNECMIL